MLSIISAIYRAITGRELDSTSFTSTYHCIGNAAKFFQEANVNEALRWICAIDDSTFSEIIALYRSGYAISDAKARQDFLSPSALVNTERRAATCRLYLLNHGRSNNGDDPSVFYVSD